ncbi:hypothetical protein FQA39_LY18712 [Lamprigera yunnana]|nr:hypothetical protein FQA39_LY18712 [Lamprigera yunnana]
MTYDIFLTVIRNHRIKLNVIDDSAVIGVQQRSIFTNAGSHLLSSIDKVVSILLESGLINYQKTIYNENMKKFKHYYNITLGEWYHLNLKNCVDDVIHNAVVADATILYVYNKSSDDIFPEKLKNPFITIDIGSTIPNANRYKIYNELIIFNLKDFHLIKNYHKTLLKYNLLNLESSLRRTYIAIYPLEKSFNLTEVFFYFYQFDIVNVIVMAYDFDMKNDSIQLFTWNPHHPSNDCGNIVTYVKEDTCQSISLIETPKIFNNHTKCFATYYLKRPSELGGTLSINRHLSVFVLQMLMQYLRLQIISIFSPNHPPTEKSGLLICSRNLHDLDNYNYSWSLPNFRENYLWIVPFPEQIDPMAVLATIFEELVWLLILVSFFLTCAVWWAISRCKRKTSFSEVLIKIFSITLFGSTNKAPSPLSLRFIFITYTIYAVHLETAFTSNLINLLTRPQYEPGIKTMEDLAFSKLPIIINEKQKSLFTSDDKSTSIYKKIKSKLMIHSDYDHMHLCSNRTALKRNSFLIEQDYFEVHLQYSKVKIKVVKADSIFGMRYAAIATKKGSYLLLSIDRIINTLVESGLLNYKEELFNRYMKKYRKLHDNRVNETEENVVLGLTHVYPIFVFWGIGLIFATTVFVAELLKYFIDRH